MIWSSPTERAMTSTQSPGSFNKADDLCKSFAPQHVGENIGLFAAHLLGVALHHIKPGVYMRGKVDLVDD